MKEKIICLRLNEELLEKIAIAAQKKNTSKSTLIRDILIKYLKNEKKNDSAKINEYETNEMNALASLSKEHYLLKKRVEELEQYQKKTYELITQLIATLKTSVLKE